MAVKRFKVSSSSTTRGAPVPMPVAKSNPVAAVAAVVAFIGALAAFGGIGWLLRTQPTQLEASVTPMIAQRQELQAQYEALTAEHTASKEELTQAVAAAKEKRELLKTEIADLRRDVRSAERGALAGEIAEQQAQAQLARLQEMATEAGLVSVEPADLRTALQELKAEQVALQNAIRQATAQVAKPEPRRDPPPERVVDVRPPAAAKEKEPAVEIKERYAKIEFVGRPDDDPVYKGYGNGPRSVKLTGKWVINNLDFRNDWKGLKLKLVIFGANVKERGLFNVIRRFEYDDIDVEKNKKAEGDIPMVSWTYSKPGNGTFFYSSNGSSVTYYDYEYEGWAMALYDSEDKLVTIKTSNASVTRIAESMIDAEQGTVCDKKGDIVR